MKRGRAPFLGSQSAFDPKNRSILRMRGGEKHGQDLADGHLRPLRLRGNRAVLFETADDGRGIPPDEQERVFERFYQVEKARSSSGADREDARGTGPGLAIVRHAVAAMKGTVSLQSEINKGTSISVGLPVARATRTRF